MSGGFLQGNPVYDYENHDYVGAYVQDDWRLRPNLTPERRPALGAVHPAAQHLFGWVSHFDQARFDQGLRAPSIRRRPPG